MKKEPERLSLQPLVTCFDKYVLYETASFYYLIGCDANETQYRILKLNRNIPKPKSLDDILFEDPVVYGGDELEALLEMINDGNKSTGGIKQVTVAYGLVGFVKFLDCYYFTLITQRKKVGCIGSNYIYAIKNAEMYAVKPVDVIGNDLSLKSMWRKVNRKLSQTNTDTAESRYMGLFQFIDITKDFFFSYTYDLTHSLQHNFIMSSPNTFPNPPFKEMYEWNKYQTEDMKQVLGDTTASLWTLPVIHGSFQQRRFSLFGRTVDLILLARRSRHYAGTRYLKRGVSVHGKVANDCEMEQIVQLDNGTHATFASYVQMRGSIPTYWYQETSVTMPKPPILVDRVDSNFLATQSHFSDLIKRYSLPIIVLDLVKHHERRKRESIVGKDFRHATEIINISMPPVHQIRYIALDFSRISKSKGGSSKTKSEDPKVKSNNINATGMEWSKIESSLGKEVAGDDHGANGGSKKASGGVMRSQQASAVAKRSSVGTKDEDLDDLDGDDDDAEEETAGGAGQPPVGRGDVLRELDEISSCCLQETSIFCSTIKHLSSLKEVDMVHRDKAREQGFLEQRGVLRTNCIDCLDRTNVAQFSMGVRFLTAALHSLGLLDSETLDPSNGMLLGLMDMFSDMGDRLALQYGGSEAHKKVSKGSGKTKQGELLTSIKRYYSNAFTDRVKQDAMNLFLGFFQPSQHNYALWDLESDYFLHNKLLYPPRPEINSILYDAGNDRNQIDSDELQTYLDDLRKRKDSLYRQYLVRRKPVTNATSDGGVSEGDVKVDVDMDKEQWWAIIEAREKMKHRLLKTKISMRAAEEWWWRMALHEFDSARQWMRLPAPRDMIPAVPYFETVHNVNTLTFFDDELSTDFLRPIDAAEVRVFSGNKALLEDIAEQESEDGEHARASGDNDPSRGEAVGSQQQQQQQQPQGGKRIDQEGFSLGSFFQKAKNIMDEILHPMAYDVQDNHTQAQGRQWPKRPDSIVATARPLLPSELLSSHMLNSTQEMAVYAKSIHVDDNSQRTYVRYCEDFTKPEVYISEKDSSSEYEFKKSLHAVSVGYEDVRGMVGLAAGAYISNVVAAGQYEGMLQSESALLATGLIASTLVFVEPSLQAEEEVPLKQEFTSPGLNKTTSFSLSNAAKLNVLPQLSKGMKSLSFSDQISGLTTPSKADLLARTSPDERVPAMLKQQSLANKLTNKRACLRYSVELSEKSKTKVDEIWSANTNFNQVGLEEELHSNLNKYLYSQHIYGQEVDTDRLAKRLSSLTNDKNIVNYMSQFSQDTIVPDIDTIKFIATDRATSYPLTELDSRLSKLKPLKKKYDLFVKQKSTLSDPDGGVGEEKAGGPGQVFKAKYSTDDEDEEARDESKDHDSEEDEQKEFDSLRVSSKEYAGFTKIGPDLYSKISNPCFICNESAVIFYTHYNAQNLKNAIMYR